MTQFTLAEGHRHIVAAAFQSWGHARPLCALVAQIVKARSLITVTLFAPFIVYDCMVKELSRHFDYNELDAHARVRLIALRHNERVILDFEGYDTSFTQAYDALLEERSIVCAKTAQEFKPIGPPDAIIIDMLVNDMLATARKDSATKYVKTYCWVSCSLTALHLLWGPSSANKDWNLHALIQEEMERSGKPLPEATHVVMSSANDRLLQVPGLPPMYQHENDPQEIFTKGYIMALIRRAGAEAINHCDSIIAATAECFEVEEALEDFRRWLTKTGREMYLVGPMLPDTIHAMDLEKEQSAKSREIDDFMDRVLKEHGPKSLIYISFGSVCWLVKSEKIWTFVDVLLERKVPFIFSHASPFAQIPEKVQEKVKSSCLGLFSPWTPQQAILKHAAIGWFVTHCGFNSIMESIHFGVPMICWPFRADQPVNVAILTTIHNVAYELLEIRTGLGLKPLYRTGTAPTGTPEAIREETNYVLDQAFGDDGKKKRANVEKLHDEIAAGWAENGSCRFALERMLNNF